MRLRPTLATYASALLALSLCFPAHADSSQYQLSVYILGAVQKPGEYSFTRGMSVLQAIAKAGGYYRASDAGLRPERDTAIAAGDLRVLLAKKTQLLVRQARLEAELENSADVTMPPGVSPTPGALQSLADERSFMLARRKAYADGLGKLKEQISLTEDEIRSLRSNKDSQNRQWASLKKELADTELMVARSLLPVQRQYLLERSLAEVDSKEQELTTSIARARQSISRIEQSIAEGDNQRRSTVLGELSAAHNDTQEVETRIATARRVLAEAEGSGTGNLEGLTPADGKRTFTILRQGVDSPRELTADENTPLEPGDVVRIQAGVARHVTGVDAEAPAQATAAHPAVAGAAKSGS